MKLIHSTLNLIVYFFVMALPVFTILWGILEPSYLPENWQHWLRHRNWYFSEFRITVLYTLTFLITIILFFFLPSRFKHKFFENILGRLKLIERLSLSPIDNYLFLKNIWKIHLQKPFEDFFSVVADELYGHVIETKAPFKDFREFDLSYQSHFCQKIQYCIMPLYENENNAVLYVRVEMRNSNNNNVLKWIAFAIEKKFETNSCKLLADDEFIYFAEARCIYKNWMTFRFNIEKIANEGFAKNNLTFTRMIGIRIRGNMKIAYISIHKK